MKSILVLSIFLLGSMLTQAQAYQPVLSDSNHWYMSNIDHIWFRTDQYIASGDTNINGQDYKIMDLFHYGRNCFIREDTATKKVYYRQIIGFKANEDVLMYDFSLQIGDSMLLFNPNALEPDSSGYYTLDGFGELPMGTGDTNKTYYLRNYQTGEEVMWIEGMGSLGLINAPAANPQKEEEITTTCLYKNGVLYYQSELSKAFGSCVINTLGIESSHQNEPFELFPNPCVDILTLALNDGQALENYQLWNMGGQMFEVKSNGKEGRFELDLRPLEKGIYFIQLQINGQYLQRKIVKM